MGLFKAIALFTIAIGLCGCQTQAQRNLTVLPTVPPLPKAAVSGAKSLLAEPAGQKSLTKLKLEWLPGSFPVNVQASANLSSWAIITNTTAKAILIDADQPRMLYRVRAVQCVTLTWDPSPDPSAVGYKVYIGVDPHIYTNSIDVGNQVFAVIPVQPLTHYHFAVTAYDAEGLESDFSAEALYFSSVEWISPVPSKLTVVP